jgi:hypothetical protein
MATKTVLVERSFLAGRDSGQAVADDRKETLELLAAHGRIGAFCALANGRSSGFSDFIKMRGALLAGGLHRVRLLCARWPS